MNTRTLALILATLCQPALATPAPVTDTGATIAAQSAAAAARIQAGQRRDLVRAADRLTLPAQQTAASTARPRPEMDAPVALTLPTAGEPGEIMR